MVRSPVHGVSWVGSRKCGGISGKLGAVLVFIAVGVWRVGWPPSVGVVDEGC